MTFAAVFIQELPMARHSIVRTQRCARHHSQGGGGNAEIEESFHEVTSTRMIDLIRRILRLTFTAARRG
jgi:hypothetical protein